MDASALDPRQILKNRTDAQIEKQVFDILVTRAPNAVNVRHIRHILKSTADTDLQEALDRLTKKGLVDASSKNNPFIDGRTVTKYSLPNSYAYPFEEYISIGGVDFPRMIGGDEAGAEDLNVFAEALSEFHSRLESEVESLSHSLMKRYWANTIGLLALFVAAFALILRSTDPVTIPTTGSWESDLLVHTVHVLPLAAVLLVFVLLTWLIARRI